MQQWQQTGGQPTSAGSLSCTHRCAAAHSPPCACSHWHLKYKGPSLSNPPQKRQVKDTQLLCRTYMQLVPPDSLTSRRASFGFLHSQFVAQSIRWSRSVAENFSNKKTHTQLRLLSTLTSSSQSPFSLRKTRLRLLNIRIKSFLYINFNNC